MTDTNVWFLQRSRTYRIELFFDKDIKKGRVAWYAISFWWVFFLEKNIDYSK